MGDHHRRRAGHVRARLHHHPPPARGLDEGGDRLVGVLHRAPGGLRRLGVGDLRLADRAGVLRRLPGREVAERGQPVRLHAAAQFVRGAPRVAAARPADRGGRRARPAWRVHRTRRGHAQQLRLDVPAVRCDSASHRREGAAGRAEPGRSRGRPGQPGHRPAGPPVLPDHGRLPRPANERPRGRTSCPNPAGPGHPGDPGHRRGLRRRLGSGRLRHHRRPLPGLRHQCLRAPRPAGALLRARRGAGRTRPSGLRSGRDPRLHWRKARPALGARHLDLGSDGADPRITRGDRGHPGHRDHHQPDREPADGSCPGGRGGRTPAVAGVGRTARPECETRFVSRSGRVGDELSAETRFWSRSGVPGGAHWGQKSGSTSPMLHHRSGSGTKTGFEALRGCDRASDAHHERRDSPVQVRPGPGRGR